MIFRTSPILLMTQAPYLKQIPKGPLTRWRQGRCRAELVSARRHSQAINWNQGLPDENDNLEQQRHRYQKQMIRWNKHAYRFRHNKLDASSFKKQPILKPWKHKGLNKRFFQNRSSFRSLHVFFLQKVSSVKSAQSILHNQKHSFSSPCTFAKCRELNHAWNTATY